MESATFTCKPDARTKLGEAVRMVMIKDKFVVEAGLPSLMTASKRAFFFNRRPASVSVLSRRGAKEDVETEFNVSGLFSTYEHDAAIAAGRDGEVLLIDPKFNADNQFTVTKVAGKVAAEIVAATFIGASLDAVALLANGSVIKISADLKTVVELRKETPTKGSFISAHDDFVLVPAKDGVDVISLSTKKSALSSAWVPHSQGEPVTAVHIFRKWKPSGGSSVLMTIGASGREVRLWTGLGNNSLELAAHLSLDLPKESVKHIAVASQEENVLISFDSSVIVLSTDEKKICFSRATEWEVEATGPFCAYNEMTKAGNYQLTMVTRSSDALTSVKLPPSIFGDANLSASGAAAPKTASHDREPNYFGSAVAKDTSSAVIVSSSLAPSSGVDTGVIEKAAAASIAAVSAEVVRKVNILKGVSASAQKDLNGLVSSLQSQSVQAAAAKQGKEHATRNASRFGSAAAAESSSASSAQATSATAAGKNVEQLTLICDFMQTAVKSAVTARSDAVIVPKVKAAVDAIGGEADVADLPLPKLTSVPQMQGFNANIDKALKAQNDYLKAEADSRAATYNAQVVRSSTTTRQSIAESKKFLSDLKAELSGLTKDIEAVKVELASSSNRNAIGAVSSANVVEDSVALVEKKDFESAVSKITQAKNFQLLLEFVGHPVVKAASEAGAFAPGSISVPAFGMLVQQLAGDIDASKGHIAPRVAFLYALSVDWDDFIDETNEGSDAKAKAILDTLAPSMGVARRNVENLSAIKDDVSIESRRQARTVARVLAKFAN